MGVASDGMASRAPAVVAESRRTTWKNRGRLKRYWRHAFVSQLIVMMRRRESRNDPKQQN